MAWIKLRMRNLGPILDANGWAVNARAKLSVPFGESLTQRATLPPGSERDLRDPYAAKSQAVEVVTVIVLIIVVILGFAWYRGKLDSVLPKKAQSVSVLGTNAPAFKLQQTNSVPKNVGTNAPPAK